MKTLDIEKIAIENINELVNIQLKYPSHSINSALGEEHLKSIYRIYIKNKKNFGFLIKTNDKKIVGFIIGSMPKTNNLIPILLGYGLTNYIKLFKVIKLSLLKVNVLGILNPLRPKSRIDACWLENIIIDPEYSNKGYGSYLLEHFEIECKKRNAEELWLSVKKINNGAINFYNRKNYHIKMNSRQNLVLNKIL